MCRQEARRVIDTGLYRLSPFGWVPAVPAGSFDPVPLGALTLLPAALFALALVGFRRRDLTA